MLRKVLLAGSSFLVLGIVATTPQSANATACGSGANLVISASCVGPFTWNGSNLSINSGTTIDGGNTGVSVTSNVGTLTNSGSINGTINTTSTGGGLFNAGTIAAIVNDASGKITGKQVGILNDTAGTIGTITNSGQILATVNSSGTNGIINRGHIATLTNASGSTISSYSSGIWNNGGSIGVLNNSGLISSSAIGIAVSNDGGTIDTIDNSGTISSSSSVALSNSGSITTINNAAGATIISSAAAAISSTGTIGTLTNNGRIAGAYGVQNSARIDSIQNAGIISGSSYGLYNTGSATIGTIDNSGTIAGSVAAINNLSVNLGIITNSGAIAGAIINGSTADLTINGGSGTIYGLLTGYNGGSASTDTIGTIGTITNSSSDLWLASGNIWLNDNILASGHTVHVTNATVKVSNAVTISGTYSQTGGGLVVVNGGSINISGSSAATVSNTAITISGSSLSAGTYTIVNANAVGTYSGDTVTISGSSGLSATLSSADGGNDLVVTLSGVTTTIGTISTKPTTDYTRKGNAEGGAAAGMGSALDAIAASSGSEALAFQSTVLSTLSSLSTSAQQTAIKQLAPTQITPAVQAATQAAAPTTSVIEQHELALAGNGSTGVSAGSDAHGYGLWGQVLGGKSLRSSTSGADGYTASNVGLVTGLDHQIDADSMAGIAVSWVRGWSWGTGNSSGSYATIDSYQLTGYGLHRFGPAFIDAQAGVGYNTYSQTRSIGFLNQKAKADYDGQQYLLKLGAGYDIPLAGTTTVTPLAGLRFLRAVNDRYVESGSSANLTVDRRGVNALTHDLGAKLSWGLDSDWGHLTPEIRLAWTHDYVQGPIASSGILGGQVFTSSVARTSPDGGKMNLAVTLDSQDDVSFRAEYEGEMRPDYQSHSGLLKVTWQF